MKVSKNIYKGGEILDLRVLKTLAEEKKSVVVRQGGGYKVLPAAWVMHWSFAQILRSPVYYSSKESEITEVDFEE
ncbi:hypothetical protein KAR91_00365 [Candidatus Pacearchaeota archaeon]|nr:hypothetical protein [Candidatus Pacearchaeota archaeon]